MAMSRTQKRPREDDDLLHDVEQQRKRVHTMAPVVARVGPPPKTPSGSEPDVYERIRASPRLDVAMKQRLLELLEQHHAWMREDASVAPPPAGATSRAGSPNARRPAYTGPRLVIHSSPLGPLPLAAPHMVPIPAALARPSKHARGRNYHRAALQHAWKNGQPTLRYLVDDSVFKSPERIRDMALAYDNAQRMHAMFSSSPGRCGYRATSTAFSVSMWTARK